MLEDIDLWGSPLADLADDLGGFMFSQLSRGAREAINLIRSAVDNPDVYVLVSAAEAGEIDPFPFFDLLEPLSIVDIDYPTPEERVDIWMEIAREHPSLRGVNRSDLVRYSASMPRYDMYMAAREAIEEAYKEGLVSRRYVPVTRENLFEKLAAYQPLDSEEYLALEEAVVKDFPRGPGTHRRPAEVAELGATWTSRAAAITPVGSCEPPTRAATSTFRSPRSPRRRTSQYAFARSIQHDLVKAGLIRTVRGARGGLVLNSDPADVTMLDVLEAIQGPVSVSLCAIDPDYCEKHADCAYNKVWHGADRLLNDHFSQITLRDLFERGAKHPAIVEAMGHAAPTVEARGAATLEAVVEGEPLLAKESCA